jgi:hypothetical protein
VVAIAEKEHIAAAKTVCVGLGQLPEGCRQKGTIDPLVIGPVVPLARRGTVMDGLAATAAFGRRRAALVADEE